MKTNSKRHSDLPSDGKLVHATCHLMAKSLNFLPDGKFECTPILHLFPNFASCGDLGACPILLCFIIVCAAIISIVHPRSVSLPLDGKLHTPTCHLMESPNTFCCWVFIIVCAAMISISPSECQVPLPGSTSIVIPTPNSIVFFSVRLAM